MTQLPKLIAGFFTGGKSDNRVTVKQLQKPIEIDPSQFEQLLRDAGKVTEIRTLMTTFRDSRAFHEPDGLERLVAIYGTIGEILDL